MWKKIFLMLTSYTILISMLQAEQTLSLIKPDAVAANHIGAIISKFENHGLQILGIKLLQLDRDQATKFYAIHQKQPFFSDLITFMTSGPIVALVLAGENAVAKNRQLMGATDPTKAAKDTIRSSFATSMTKNAVHGSDSLQTAKEEIAFFFALTELKSR